MSVLGTDITTVFHGAQASFDISLTPSSPSHHDGSPESYETLRRPDI